MDGGDCAVASSRPLRRIPKMAVRKLNIVVAEIPALLQMNNF
jgi:hypothetical protein